MKHAAPRARPCRVFSRRQKSWNGERAAIVARGRLGEVELVARAAARQVYGARAQGEGCC